MGGLFLPYYDKPVWFEIFILFTIMFFCFFLASYVDILFLQFIVSPFLLSEVQTRLLFRYKGKNI